MDAEEKLRREAVRRALAGESAAAIAQELRRTRRWVVKWLARYDPTDEAWARERSRAPRRVANRSAAKLEALVLSVRARLQANPWAQIGATAILWELAKLRLRQLPEPRTIERILERAAVPRRARRERYRPKGTPYPAPAAFAPNDCHEADLIGPRHLAGAIPFFVLNVVDLGRHAVACELLASKADRATAEALLRAWGRLGLPRRLKLDNWLIAGGTMKLPLTVRLCLALGVTVVFIPFAEPWRNGTVEQFNDTFDKRFFRTERFRDLGHLLRRMAAFERFHDAHHRYAAHHGATPDEVARRTRFRPRLPDPAFRIPERLPRRGRVEFIRLVRSDRILHVLGREILLSEAFVHEYVTATLDIRQELLTVQHRGRRVAVRRFRLEE